jgi:hypothetical protein
VVQLLPLNGPQPAPKSFVLSAGQSFCREQNFAKAVEQKCIQSEPFQWKSGSMSRFFLL